MNNSAILAIEKLRKLLNPRGAKAEFCRKTGMARGLLDAYLAGNSKPGLDQIDKFAEALGVQPWDLIKPDDSIGTKIDTKETGQALELLSRLTFIWGVLDHSQRQLILDQAETLARGRVPSQSQPGKPIDQKKKA